jgi:hypothetical protein
MELNAEFKDYINKAVDVVDIPKDPTDWRTAYNIAQGFYNRQQNKHVTKRAIQTRLKSI